MHTAYVARSVIAQAHQDLLAKVVRKIPGHDPTLDCWACGVRGDLQRCRIVAAAAGGDGAAGNTWLLCHECHHEQPDGARIEGQRYWILEHELHSERRGRVAHETVSVVMALPRAHEWAADRLLDEEVLLSIVNGVRDRIGRAHLQSVRTSLRYELVADYEEWMAARQPGAGAARSTRDVGDAARRRIEKLFAETPTLFPSIEQALSKLKREGKRTGGLPPYGYELGADGKTLAPLEAEQRVIAEARALHADGMSLRTIAETLKSRGMRSRVGRRFEPTQIKRMIGYGARRNVTSRNETT